MELLEGGGVGGQTVKRRELEEEEFGGHQSGKMEPGNGERILRLEKVTRVTLKSRFQGNIEKTFKKDELKGYHKNLRKKPQWRLL